MITAILIKMVLIIVSVISYIMRGFSLLIPDGIETAMNLFFSKVYMFNGIFAVADLMLAMNFLLGLYIGMVLLKYSIMGLNIIPGINIQLPERREYLTSEIVTNSDPKIPDRHITREKKVYPKKTHWYDR